MMTTSWADEDQLVDLFGDEINRHLDELPEEFRQALLLADLDGLSYYEITEIMGTPVGTLRSRISRARTFPVKCSKSLTAVSPSASSIAFPQPRHCWRDSSGSCRVATVVDSTKGRVHTRD